MINTVIFDLDGTLLNTLEDLKNSTNYALNEFGYESMTLEQVRQYVGNGVRRLIELAIPNGEANSDFEECLAIFKKHYAKNMYNNTKPYYGIVEVLESLKQQGIKTGVVSNKFDAAVKKLCEKYFGSLIDIAIGESDKVKKKPAPDSVFEAMNQLGSTKSETIYVGDSDVDAKTANNAGLTCVGVTWGFRDRCVFDDNGVENIIDSPQELLKKIKEININIAK